MASNWMVTSQPSTAEGGVSTPLPALILHQDLALAAASKHMHSPLLWERWASHVLGKSLPLEHTPPKTLWSVSSAAASHGQHSWARVCPWLSPSCSRSRAQTVLQHSNTLRNPTWEIWQCTGETLCGCQHPTRLPSAADQHLAARGVCTHLGPILRLLLAHLLVLGAAQGRKRLS